MTNRINLNGTWKVRWYDAQRGDRVTRLLGPNADMSRAWNVEVPGEIHQMLIDKGLISEPTTGLNCLAARWVEETVWHYRRTFDAVKPKKGQRAYLVFEGLDLAAKIFLNGKEVGQHANYFCPCRIDVTDHIINGENVLVVSVESGLYSTANKSAEGYDRSLEGCFTKRVWLRKTQSSHGWDWSPRLLNVGIHGNVYLEIVGAVRWDAATAFTELSDDFSCGTVTARVFAEGLNKKEIRGTLTVTIAQTKSTVKVPVTIKQGMNRLEAKVAVANPSLWWPVGHGDQPLYTVDVSLEVGGATIGKAKRRVGFRSIKVDQSAHPQSGSYFIIEINGKKIFCKGGNFVPADIIFTRIDKKRYAGLVNLAIESNCNFLRIWGGGLYESDDFYDICDEKGILVWQEFIFACANYPATDRDFYHNVKLEATHQIRRLASHASLVVWCGNNEMEWGGWSWGWETTGVTFPDYSFFHRLFPVLLTEEDPTRYYQPSSPYSPGYTNSNRDDVGDQHPWSIGFGDTDFRKYRNMICRFPNEGGILGPTALKTVKACLPAGMDYPGSFAWEQHDNSVSYWGGDKPHPDVMLEQWLGIPLSEMGIEDYVYWGGLVQGMGLAEYAKNFRRRMFDSSSAIFWMYNDCWPATRSWTTVDYYLRRTPAFWPVKRAFAPVTVVVVREEKTVRIYGVNEGEQISGTLRYGIMGLAGRYPLDETVSVDLPANASTVIAEFDASAWDRAGVNSHVAFAILEKSGDEIARDCLFLPLLKEMRWPKTQVNVALRSGKAIFTSRTFALRVCLDLDGETPLSDNFFDVYPGIPTVIDWPKKFSQPKIKRIGNLT